jgi:hypothetical protein
MSEPGDLPFLDPANVSESTSIGLTSHAPPTGTVFSVFLLLKASQYVIYIFGWIFIPSTVFQWVLTIIASAADFWFTKNVAGRLILGLRWSSTVTEDGESQWVFDFVPGGIQDRVAQRRTFWSLLLGGVVLWGLFSFFSLIRLSLGWLFVAGIGLSLACSNAWGFWKCDSSIGVDARESAMGVVRTTLFPMIGRAGLDLFGSNLMPGADRPGVL